MYAIFESPRLSGIDLGFNRWMQRILDALDAPGVLQNEAKITHLLLGNSESIDMGALAEGSDDSPDRRVI